MAANYGTNYSVDEGVPAIYFAAVKTSYDNTTYMTKKTFVK